MTSDPNGASHAGGAGTLGARVAALELLHDIGRRITSILEIEKLLPEMIEQLRQVLRVEIVSVMLLADDRKTLRIAASSGLPPEVVANARVTLGEGISGQAAARGEPILVRDMSQHPEFAPSPYASQYTTQSLLSVPLRIGDRVLGVVNINNKLSGEPLDDEDLALVSTFCAQAALALENSRLHGDLRAEVRRVTAELEKSNEELLRIQEFTESILSHMSSGLLAIDLDNRVTKLNAAGAALLGVEPVDHGPAGGESGHTLTSLFGREKAGQLLAQPDDAPPFERRELTVHARNGRESLIGYSTSPLLGPDGRQSGHVLIFRDLTRLKKMETELVRMERMASLGVLGAGIAHEIRNPLAAMRFNLDFLKEDAGDRPEIGVIRKNVDRLDDLVRKLLRFARPQQPSFAREPLRDRVEAVLALVGQQAHAGKVIITATFEKDLPDVILDGSQAEQVILNVLLNAIQAMPTGGMIRLDTHVVTRDGRRLAEVAISDEGPGLPEGIAAQIFEPFFTTRQEGTGLGLAVSHRIMEDHRGYIEVAPPEPTRRGTTFLIGFPLADRS